MRGHGLYGAGGRRGEVDRVWDRFNLPIPSDSACEGQAPAYSCRSGPQKQLHLCALDIMNRAGLEPICSTDCVEVHGAALGRDGMGLKAGFTPCFIRERPIGALEESKIDIAFLKANPDFDFSDHQEVYITEAETTVITHLTGLLCMPLGQDFTNKKVHNNGKAELSSVLEWVSRCQVCAFCAKLASAEDGVSSSKSDCNSTCDDCVRQRTVCARCCLRGHTRWEPALRACDTCLARKTKCLRMAILAWVADCEQKNKSAFELLRSMKADGTLPPDCLLLVGLPEGPHAGKNLFGGLKNWMLRVKGHLVNLDDLIVCREDKVLGVTLSKYFTRNAAHCRDMQNFQEKVDMCCQGTVEELERCKCILTTELPNPHRPREGNKVGCFDYIMAACEAAHGQLLAIDKGSEELLLLRLHSSMNVVERIPGFNAPSSLAYAHGLTFIGNSHGAVMAVNLDNAKSKIILNPDKMATNDVQNELGDEFDPKAVLSVNRRNLWHKIQCGCDGKGDGGCKFKPGALSISEQSKDVVKQRLAANGASYDESCGVKILRVLLANTLDVLVSDVPGGYKRRPPSPPDLEPIGLGSTLELIIAISTIYSEGTWMLFVLTVKGTVKRLVIRPTGDGLRVDAGSEHEPVEFAILSCREATTVCAWTSDLCLVGYDTGDRSVVSVVSISRRTETLLSVNIPPSNRQLQLTRSGEEIFVSSQGSSTTTFSAHKIALVQGNLTVSSCRKIFECKTSEHFKDGVDGGARLVHVDAMCTVGKTIFIADHGVLRKLTSARALAYLLETIAIVFKSFNTDGYKTKWARAQTLPEAVDLMRSLEGRCSSMASELASELGLKDITKRGANGLGSHETFRSIQLAVLALDELRCTVEDVCPGFVRLINMKALTQIMNESLHSLMRAGNSDMPTTLEYCRRFNGVVLDMVLQMCNPGFIYKTGHRSSGYGKVGLAVDEQNLTIIREHFKSKGKRDKSRMSVRDKVTLAQTCKIAGKSIPQVTIRDLTCKRKPGTLPHGAWRNEIHVPELPNSRSHATDVIAPAAGLEFHAGSVVVVVRNGAGVVFMLLEGVSFSATLMKAHHCRERSSTIGMFAVDTAQPYKSLAKSEVRLHITGIDAFAGDGERDGTLLFDLSDFHETIVDLAYSGGQAIETGVTLEPCLPENADCDDCSDTEARSHPWTITCCNTQGCRHSDKTVCCDGCDRWFHQACVDYDESTSGQFSCRECDAQDAKNGDGDRAGEGEANHDGGGGGGGGGGQTTTRRQVPANSMRRKRRAGTS